MDHDTVVLYSHPRCSGLLSLFIILCCREIDVVGLPSQRRKAHVHIRRRRLIDAAAIIVLAFETEGIEHLDFVSALKIEAAVTASLTGFVWAVWQQEFNVQLVVLEFLLAASSLASAIRHRSFFRTSIGPRFYHRTKRSHLQEAPSPSLDFRVRLWQTSRRPFRPRATVMAPFSITEVPTPPDAIATFSPSRLPSKCWI